MNENSIANMPLVFALPQMESVTVQRDVVYAQENSDDLTMDLYRPAESESATLPAVILVTGYADASDQGVFGYKLKEWARIKAGHGSSHAPA